MTTGEGLDRLTILELRMRYGRTAKERERAKDEWDDLIMEVDTFAHSATYHALARLNRIMWFATDAARRATDPEWKGYLATCLLELNQQRRKAIREANR